MCGRPHLRPHIRSCFADADADAATTHPPRPITGAAPRNRTPALGVLIGGIVRLTVPELTDQQRHAAAERLTGEISHLGTGGTAAIVLDVDHSYQAWLALCPNPSLVNGGTKTMHGLAYKLRVANIDEIVPAELAAEAAHMLNHHQPAQVAA